MAQFINSVVKFSGPLKIHGSIKVIIGGSVVSGYFRSGHRSTGN